jgi:predicted nucleic acid-binding protein
VIIEIELLSWPDPAADNYQLLSSFLADCFIINLSPEIKEKAIEIRRNYGLKVPDAIIAATAITKQLSFFSADDIFYRVKELNFIHVQ